MRSYLWILILAVPSLAGANSYRYHTSRVYAETAHGMPHRGGANSNGHGPGIFLGEIGQVGQRNLEVPANGNPYNMTHGSRHLSLFRNAQGNLVVRHERGQHVLEGTQNQATVDIIVGRLTAGHVELDLHQL